MTDQHPFATSARRGSKASGIAQTLSEAIHNGAFVPGQRLVEADLTESLGISRSLLREAFRSLSAQGTIELVPNRGAIVRRLSRREALELFEIRTELEALAARGAARNIGLPGVREDFLNAVSAIDDDSPRPSTSDYLLENQRFHAAIFAAAGNRELERLNRQMQLSLIMAQISTLLTPEAIGASLREHRILAGAILAGDAEGANRAARDHLARACAFVQTLPAHVFRAEPMP